MDLLEASGNNKDDPALYKGYKAAMDRVVSIENEMNSLQGRLDEARGQYSDLVRRPQW